MCAYWSMCANQNEYSNLCYANSSFLCSVHDLSLGMTKLLNSHIHFLFFSEPMWPIEARNAAIANSYFTCAINRVGTVS